MAKDYYGQTPCPIGIIWKSISDRQIVIRAPSMQLFCLTPIGSDIFKKCSGKTSILDILEYLRERYPDVPGSRIDSETRRFLYWMELQGIIIVDWDGF